MDLTKWFSFICVLNHKIEPGGCGTLIQNINKKQKLKNNSYLISDAPALLFLKDSKLSTLKMFRHRFACID